MRKEEYAADCSVPGGGGGGGRKGEAEGGGGSRQDLFKGWSQGAVRLWREGWGQGWRGQALGTWPEVVRQTTCYRDCARAFHSQPNGVKRQTLAFHEVNLHDCCQNGKAYPDSL